MSALTLEQFRATGRDVEDVNEAIGGALEAGDEPAPGRVYEAGLHIHKGEGALWCLTIGNDSEQGEDLAAFEAKLYEWGVGEGALDTPIPLYWRGVFGCLYERQSGPDADGWMTVLRLNDNEIREFNAAALTPLTDDEVVAQMKAAIEASEVQS